MTNHFFCWLSMIEAWLAVPAADYPASSIILDEDGEAHFGKMEIAG